MCLLHANRITHGSERRDFASFFHTFWIDAKLITLSCSCENYFTPRRSDSHWHFETTEAASSNLTYLFNARACYRIDWIDWMYRGRRSRNSSQNSAYTVTVQLQRYVVDGGCGTMYDQANKIRINRKSEAKKR